MAKVAFLGLGVMGFPMAGHLAAKGHEVTVYNRTFAKAEAWTKKHKGKAAKTPKEAAAGQEIVFCCVGNDEHLRAVVLGPDGAFAGMAKGAIFFDNTTASADIAREFHAEGKKKGIDFIDAPVSGGQAGAENGQLTVMCGGEQGPFDKAKPVADAYAKAVTLIGPPGSGQITKMMNQMCIAGLVQGLAEAINLGQKRRPRHGQGDRRHLQGRGAELADGQSLEGHGRGQVRVRLRRRLDAQGSRHRHGRGQARQGADAGGGPGRPVLCPRAGARRRALGHVQPDPAAAEAMRRRDYKLWGRAGWGSTIVEAQLVWYGLPYTFEPVEDLFRTPDAAAKLEKVNPLAQVPTLVMPDGSVMSESAAITLLLADITGKDSLVPPANARERAKFLRWLVFIVANIYPTFTYADDPARFVSVNAARDPFRAATDAYAQRLWHQIEGEAGSPWFLGERFSALDIYVGVMTRWRPKRGWFESETPHLFAIARRADQVPELAEVWKRNFPTN